MKRKKLYYWNYLRTNNVAKATRLIFYFQITNKDESQKFDDVSYEFLTRTLLTLVRRKPKHKIMIFDSGTKFL